MVSWVGEEMRALEPAWVSAPNWAPSVAAPRGLHSPSCWDAKKVVLNGSYSAYTRGLCDGIWAAQLSMCHQAPSRRSLSDASSDTASTTDTALEGTLPDEFELLTTNLRGSAARQQQALDYVSEHAQSLCKTQRGSRLVQTALESVRGRRLQALVEQMKGFVLEACKSPHGNHVLLKVLDLVGSDGAQFMVEEMTGKAVVIARDRFGCRVIQELVEICPQEQVSGLVDELMTDCSRLLRHPYANFVVQAAIRFGSQGRRLQIADVLSQDLKGFSKHRIAKNVVRLVNEMQDHSKTNIENASQQVQQVLDHP